MEYLARVLTREIPDFPKPGVLFRDITPVLGNAVAFQEVIDGLVEWASPLAPEAIVAVESRGFIFGAPVALALGIAFVPIRKPGKLPHETVSESYDLEYGNGVIEIHRDALVLRQRVLLIDDVLATGGTASAAIRLITTLGAKVVGAAFVIELKALEGRCRINEVETHALITY